MGYFAVVDTETNWVDQVMSIGTVVAEESTLSPVAGKYHVFSEAYAIGGMYENAVFLQTPAPPVLCTRQDAMEEVCRFLRQHGVSRVFAYNAVFDRKHLPEMQAFSWHDIMRLAAYRQHNSKIPADAPVCTTGRLKRGYGVEDMLRLLADTPAYRETHNAYLDAVDELRIIRLLGHPVSRYPAL